MTALTDSTETLSSPSLKEDEYLNASDGLVYCSRCHSARQVRKQFANRTFTPYIMCRCQREVYEKEKAEHEHTEFLIRISQMKSSGLQDKALYDYNFSNDIGINPEIKHAHTYVERWDDMKKTSTGLLLWGGVGTGKSFFAGCIANALLEQGIPVLMTNFARILNTLTGMFSEDRNQFISSLNQYHLLIIDDLGVERNSEFALEQVFNVIDSRYRSKKPMIITTNLTLSELKNPSDLMRKRIYDRILENCIPLKINNQNIRELNASANMTRARQLFT